MSARTCLLGLSCLLVPVLQSLIGSPDLVSTPQELPEGSGEVSACSGELTAAVKACEPSAPDELCWLGQDFVCFNQTEAGGLRSEEYRLRTEEVSAWTQRVTVRQFRLGAQVPLAGFCEAFLKAVSAACPDSQVACLLKPGTRGVYLVEGGEKDPLSRTNACLLLLEAAAGEVLLFQYSQRPGRLDQTLAELQLNAWRERFLGQARRQGGVGEPGSVP